jgi:[ribosomal protein S18]-alanine N-acetyltransferase
MGRPVSAAELRRLSTADIEGLVAMESAHQPNPWSEAVFSDEIAANSRAYFGIVEGTQLLAYGGVLVIDEEAHVLNLLVAPDQRRRGHARRLLVELIMASVEMGAHHLTLEVRSQNQAALDLYRRFGLAPVGIRSAYYGDDDAVIMWAHDIDGAEFLANLAAMR